jgi:DNA polymerase-3 subunit epsilon
MTLKLVRPLIFFDIESTGLDFKYDRIVEIGAIKLHPDGKREMYLQRVNPGMKIPNEVSLIIGITNEDVAKEPGFADIAQAVEDFFLGCDLAGYNLARFDVKILSEELKRTGRDLGLEERGVVDVQTIFHQKEKRDLAAAYKYYCNKDLQNAHSAKADATATLEILMAQLERYPDLPCEVPELHVFCKGDRDRYVDSEGKFMWRDAEAVFNFGKFRSQRLRDVAARNPEYLDWVVSPERQFPQDVIDICYNAKQGRFPTKPANEPKGTSGA